MLAVMDGTAVEQVVCVDGKPEGTIMLNDPVAGCDRAFGFQACCRRQAGDVLVLIYPPGTTGPPKGVVLTHAQMLAEPTATNSLRGEVRRSHRVDVLGTNRCRPGFSLPFGQDAIPRATSRSQLTPSRNHDSPSHRDPR